MLTIDGTNMIFGRLASQVAKKLMNGEEVNLVNAEKMVIMGNPVQISGRYKLKRTIKHKGTPEHSPVWSRVPHMLVKKMIRGMLPRKTTPGKDALARLKVYTGNPRNLKENIKLENATFDGVSKHITVHELCRSIGYTG
jgi:large subunit ribosomal protein L13